MKALVAVEPTILTTIWHMLTNGDYYHDPGADYYTRYNPARQTARALRDLHALGYDVTIQPLSRAS